MKVRYGDVAENAVWAGVDTHAATHWLSAVGPRGSEPFSGEFAAGPEGYEKPCAKIRGAGRPGGRRRGAHGHLRRRRLEGPGRAKRGRGRDKDDAADALRAARQALSGESLAIPKSQDGWVEEVRNLTVAREKPVEQCSPRRTSPSPRSGRRPTRSGRASRASGPQR